MEVEEAEVVEVREVREVHQLVLVQVQDLLVEQEAVEVDLPLDCLVQVVLPLTEVDR